MALPSLASKEPVLVSEAQLPPFLLAAFFLTNLSLEPDALAGHPQLTIDIPLASLWEFRLANILRESLTAMMFAHFLFSPFYLCYFGFAFTYLVSLLLCV